MTKRPRRRIPREWREGQRARGKTLLLRFFLYAGRLFCKGLRVQLSRELFDSGDDARRGAIHGVADHRVMTIADGVNNLPTREGGELFHFARGVFVLRFRKHEKIRL